MVRSLHCGHHVPRSLYDSADRTWFTSYVYIRIDGNVYGSLGDAIGGRHVIGKLWVLAYTCTCRFDISERGGGIVV